MRIKVKDEFSPELALVLCYPYVSKEEYRRRIMELIDLGVEEIELSGPLRIGSIRVLGKGYRGLVVKAYRGGELYALKVRRVDSERSSLEEEAIYNRMANGIGVGPTVYDYSRNFILREYVDGLELVRWIETAGSEVLGVIRKMLYQAFKLDMLGLDHGELARPLRNVLVKKGGEPVIIDFESASLKRRARNLTRLSQYLLLRDNIISKRVREEIGALDKNQILKALRDYKRNPSLRTFRAFLKTIRL